MFHILLRSMSPMQQGLISLVLGLVLLLGALGKLGFLQSFLNIVLIIIGLYLFVWGLDKSNLWKRLTSMKK